MARTWEVRRMQECGERHPAIECTEASQSGWQRGSCGLNAGETRTSEQHEHRERKRTLTACRDNGVDGERAAHGRVRDECVRTPPCQYVYRCEMDVSGAPSTFPVWALAFWVQPGDGCVEAKERMS